MAKFFRLEFEPGQGIYTGDHDGIFDARYIIAGHYGTMVGPRHPPPYKDSLLMENLKNNDLSVDGVRYGFNSETQFRSWFPDDTVLEKLSEIGVHLVCYEAPAIIVGNSQSVVSNIDYDDELEELYRIPLSEYLDK